MLLPIHLVWLVALLRRLSDSSHGFRRQFHTENRVNRKIKMADLGRSVLLPVDPGVSGSTHGQPRYSLHGKTL